MSERLMVTWKGSALSTSRFVQQVASIALTAGSILQVMSPPGTAAMACWLAAVVAAPAAPALLLMCTSFTFFSSCSSTTPPPVKHTL